MRESRINIDAIKTSANEARLIQALKSIDCMVSNADIELNYKTCIQGIIEQTLEDVGEE